MARIASAPPAVAALNRPAALVPAMAVESQSHLTKPPAQTNATSLGLQSGPPTLPAAYAVPLQQSLSSVSEDKERISQVPDREVHSASIVSNSNGANTTQLHSANVPTFSDILPNQLLHQQFLLQCYVRHIEWQRDLSYNLAMAAYVESCLATHRS